METPKEQFKTLILRLLGDKDHERLLEIAAKVEKSHRKESSHEIESRLAEWRVLHVCLALLGVLLY